MTVNLSNKKFHLLTCFEFDDLCKGAPHLDKSSTNSWLESDIKWISKDIPLVLLEMVKSICLITTSSIKSFLILFGFSCDAEVTSGLYDLSFRMCLNL